MSEEESYDNASTDQEPYEEELYDDEEEDQYIDKASNERFKEINKNIVQLYDKSLAIFAKFQYDDFNEQWGSPILPQRGVIFSHFAPLSWQSTLCS